MKVYFEVEEECEYEVENIESGESKTFKDTFSSSVEITPYLIGYARGAGLYIDLNRYRLSKYSAKMVIKQIIEHKNLDVMLGFRDLLADLIDDKEDFKNDIGYDDDLEEINENIANDLASVIETLKRDEDTNEFIDKYFTFEEDKKC